MKQPESFRNFFYQKQYDCYHLDHYVIVIEQTLSASVFVRSSAKHNEFKPVLDWIELDAGKSLWCSKYLMKSKDIGMYLRNKKS